MKRRNLLIGGAGIAGAGVLIGWQRNELARFMLTRGDNKNLRISAAGAADTSGVCQLTPEQAEGPFFVAAPLRRDVREDRSGLQLDLSMHVVSMDSCQGIAGAVVEIWHCDAAGRYSGYPEHLSRRPLDTLLFLDGPDGHVETTNSKMYLRGAQVSDATGLVQFRTILPGWYEPRVPHIHVKVFQENRSYLTTQLYFPEPLTTEIYGQHPDYKPHGLSPYNFDNDGVLRAYPNAESLMLQPIAAGGSLQAECVLGIG